jgi:hypothetical protein
MSHLKSSGFSGSPYSGVQPTEGELGETDHVCDGHCGYDGTEQLRPLQIGCEDQPSAVTGAEDAQPICTGQTIAD